VKLLTLSRPIGAAVIVPKPARRTAVTGYAIHAAEAGTAILTYTRDLEDRIEVTAIERLPAGLDPIVSWLGPQTPLGCHFIVDAAGLGQALWDRLGARYRRRGWTLYEARGRDRQELVNALLVAQSEGRIAIAPTSHADAMKKALLGYRRTVGEDGAIGAELVVALALAVVGRRPSVPRVM
jgi:hypothetical protein